MSTETLMIIISVGVILLIAIISVCGFYLINILRNLDKIMDRVDEVTNMTKKYVVKPLFTVSDILKKYRLFKKITKSFKKKKNEKKNDEKG